MTVRTMLIRYTLPGYRSIGFNLDTTDVGAKRLGVFITVRLWKWEYHINIVPKLEAV